MKNRKIETHEIPWVCLKGIPSKIVNEVRHTSLTGCYVAKQGSR